MKQPTPWWVWLIPLPVVWWAALLVAGVWQPGMNLLQLTAQLSTALQRPWDIRWTQYSGRCLLLLTLAYGMGAGTAVSSTAVTRRGEEHGSARWGDVFSIARKYRDKGGGNLILTQHFSIGWDGYRHKHNTNVLVVGGSGAGKTRGYCVPNILEAVGRSENAPACSIVCSDPKAEILRKTGALLVMRGYEVRVLDLTSPATSFCYNPLRYIQSDKDALRMIDTLIQATTPPDSKSSDPFWVKSETALLQALVLYLVHEAPEEEQNLPMVMEMLQAAEVREEDEEYESPLDMLFSRLEMRDPESIALKQYRVYKMAAGKTAKSILVSVGVRLSAFLLPEVAKMTCTDELHLEELGEKKVALFCCIPDSEKSLNYLVGLMYGQLIQTLYYEADRKHKGRLPVPVHLLIDEAPNISLPTDSFLASLATMRSRGVFTSYICQNMAQIKALFNKQWESLVGLCDSFLYLGGSEKETHKYVSELIGNGIPHHERIRYRRNDACNAAAGDRGQDQRGGVLEQHPAVGGHAAGRAVHHGAVLCDDHDGVRAYVPLVFLCRAGAHPSGHICGRTNKQCGPQLCEKLCGRMFGGGGDRAGVHHLFRDGFRTACCRQQCFRSYGGLELCGGIAL